MAASNLYVTGFTGHPKHEITALTYMQARHYDPVAGRFLSIDPVTFMDQPEPGQFNRYAYTWNDPINTTDPTGRVVKFNGNEDYNKQAAADLETVRNSSPENAAMVGGLEGSDHVHTMQPATGNDGVNGASPTNQEGASTSGEGSGSTIYYDPNNNQTRHGDTRPPEAGLGHELGHAEEFDSGTFEFQDINDMVGPDGIVPPSGLTPKHEIGPIKRENDVRKSLGAPSRGCYTRTCGGG
ncbi:RHS repeat-associated core domain-containing protein [Litorimonas taeanensis]|uniref:RHS repeat-associated core domain-containing protein n=1 Tax=Litorimonas taeanensis TaxID=568099 RepID=UPI0014747DB7|nr:RHS repeat-associated core domain-containing protein [Litorimonas taeanensis]